MMITRQFHMICETTWQRRKEFVLFKMLATHTATIQTECPSRMSRTNDGLKSFHETLNPKLTMGWLLQQDMPPITDNDAHDQINITHHVGFQGPLFGQAMHAERVT